MSVVILCLSASAQGGAPFEESRVLEAGRAIQSWDALRLAEGRPPLQESQLLAAARGELITGLHQVPGSPHRVGWGLAVMEAPVERLWAGLNDELMHVPFSPVDHTELVSGERCRDQRVVWMHLPIPLLSDRWWVVRNQYNPELTRASGGRAYELSWREEPGVREEQLSERARDLMENADPVAFSRGGWLLVELDEQHTLGFFHSWTDPGGQVPAAFSYLATMGIETTFAEMTRYASRAELPCASLLSP